MIYIVCILLLVSNFAARDQEIMINTIQLSENDLNSTYEKITREITDATGGTFKKILHTQTNKGQ